MKAHLKFYQNSYNCRQRKLQETLLAVQQLDTSMANLRKWLAGIEHDLSTPVIYQECSLLEVQHKLQLQQVREVTLLYCSTSCFQNKEITIGKSLLESMINALLHTSILILTYTLIPLLLGIGSI